MRGIKLGVLLIVAIFLFSAVHAQELGGLEQTQLLVFLEVEGDHDNAGDTFRAHINVENIGLVTAENVHSLLVIPEGWNVLRPAVYPDGTERVFESLGPGESESYTLIVTRSDEDASIFVSAWADNAEKVISDIIPIPIHPIGLILFTIAAFAIIHLRKK